ncbi:MULTISPECIES: beta-ketoacyl synthase N-terminal-like domain-containing protein [Mesonia]|uniref:beta-ketoacyl synthase N-terminal-like domain-containing protein n=1 Tax=Mesonia TaxID=232115 RepID=UPI000C4363AB|nr:MULTISPECIES: beta-ketoacyl synthase N-terminal-like domain-containing protein [Mesonia]MAN28434.1 beta-ketoacyl synthase [Mesonia sp.]MAQ40144.1 beta-ketoacyl synthase [Mesonia sp.]MBJ98929.1 beta-ketoacyl synthase [Flavobacteriaceae bacterium]
MKDNIYINSFASISGLGNTSEKIWKHYQLGQPLFQVEEFEGKKTYVSKLSIEAKDEIEALQIENSKYKDLDPSVLYAMLASRKAFQNANWNQEDFGVNIGSSRGATFLFEKYHQQFLKEGITSTLASPTTTLGNISSWVLQDLQSNGPEISHSITCSTALHSITNAIAWLKSGMVNKFLVGGSEAPLTPFTIAQMNAVKLYAKYDENEKFPNRSLEIDKNNNTMILGEAAASFCISTSAENSIAEITGWGYASETLVHSISISKDASCLQKSMKMALAQSGLENVDMVIMHAPGTKKGDWAELNAIKAVFGEELPLITSNKFLIGHTFGASGAMSLEMALLMLQQQEFIENPFFENIHDTQSRLKNIMVNAVGFGGNAVSIIVSKQ